MSYINFDKKTNHFTVTVSEDICNIIPLRELPLKFQVEDWLTSDVYFKCDLNPGMWASYDNTGFKNFSIYTNSGKLIKKSKFDIYNETGPIEEFFYIWITSRQRTNGIVLGAGNGRWGEWLFPVINNECRVLLVEGDPNNHSQLSNSHRARPNVMIDKSVVSVDGGLVKFWIAPQNMVSSLDVSVVKKFFPNEVIEYVELESKTINNLVKEYFHEDLNWIRIDLEGLDHKIIMSLDMSLVPELKMVVFENMNISQKEIIEIKNKLIEEGFNQFIEFGIDTVCLKN